MADNTNPWADAANQAVGALYKYYMTKPNAADMEAARIEREYNAAKLQDLRLSNQASQRQLGLGDYALPNLSAPIRNHLYKQSLTNPSVARTFEDAYVNDPMQVDTGDSKYIVGGTTGLPIQQYEMGTPPKVEIDTKGGQVIRTPGVASPNRPSVAHLMGALIQQESGGNPNAVSPAGAAGIAQIMPDTARDPGYGVQPLQNWDGQDPRTAPVEEQLRFSQDYLAAMKANNGGSDELALAAYNAGPGAVQQHGGVPPYPETQNYVQNVMENSQQPQITVQPDGTTITPLPTAPAVQEKQNETDRLKNIQGDLVNDDISRALNRLNDTLPVTGIGGALTKWVPGSPAFDFGEVLSSIQANIGFDKLQAMREASPTGGALGQVSEFENRLLQAVYGSLEQSQSEEQLRYNLMRLHNTYNDIIHGEGQGPGRYNIPTIEKIMNMQTPDELEGVFTFFNDNPPDDIENAVRYRVNQLGL